MIFEIDLWASFLSDNDRKLKKAFNNLGCTRNYNDEAQPFFNFENHLFNFAFFMRRLIEEAEDAVALKNHVEQLSQSEILAAEVFAFGKTTISFPGRIGPMFRLNQSFSLTIRELCDKIIHYRLLNLMWPTPNDEAGFFLSSDRDAHRKIYFVSLEEITKCVDHMDAIATTTEGDF